MNSRINSVDTFDSKQNIGNVHEIPKMAAMALISLLCFELAAPLLHAV